MNFTQPEFLILFSLFLPIYFMLRRRLRAQTLVLTIATYIFYAWFDWRFLGLLLLSTVVDFYFAIVIDYAKHSEKRPYPINVARCTLWASVAYNLAVLGLFKYFDFFNLAALELRGDEMRPSTSVRGRTATCEHRPACTADRAAQGLDGAGRASGMLCRLDAHLHAAKIAANLATQWRRAVSALARQSVSGQPRASASARCKRRRPARRRLPAPLAP